MPRRLTIAGIVAFQLAWFDVGATSSIVPPPLEKVVCPISHIFTGRPLPATYRQRETCDVHAVSYFHKDLCTEAELEVYVTEALRPEMAVGQRVRVAYLPLKTISITGVGSESEEFLFYAVQVDGSLTAKYWLRAVEPVNGPSSTLDRVRHAISNCR